MSHPSGPTGWICPKCGASNSPYNYGTCAGVSCRQGLESQRQRKQSEELLKLLKRGKQE